MIASAAGKNMVSMHAEENPVSSHGSLLDIAVGTTSLRNAGESGFKKVDMKCYRMEIFA